MSDKREEDDTSDEDDDLVVLPPPPVLEPMQPISGPAALNVTTNQSSAPSPSSSRKGVKMTQFTLQFKLRVFKQLETNGITDADLHQRKQSATTKSKLETIINVYFADKYPKHIVNGKLTSDKMKRVKNLIKGWKSTTNEKAINLNYVTAKKGAVRCGGGGLKDVIDDDIQLAVYKYVNLLTDGFTTNQLTAIIAEHLVASGKYTLIPNDPDQSLTYVRLTENKINGFKRKWNLQSIQACVKTAYDVDDTMTQHLMVCCQGFTIRLLLKELITYVGHHDQVMFWYSEDKGRILTTSLNRSLCGKKSRQHGRSTFTVIPSIYHLLETDTVEFGPLVTIMESKLKSKSISPQYLKALRKQGLSKGFDAMSTNYNCVSSNGWQGRKTIGASVAVLRRKPRGIVAFDNWREFCEPSFIDKLLSHDVYPIYNVPAASGLTGWLDLYPNMNLRSEFIDQRTTIERENPKVCYTKGGNLRALPREYLARAAVNAMNTIKADQSRLDTYKKFAHFLGYSADIDDADDDAATFMKHATKSFSQPFHVAFRCLTNIDADTDPIKDTASQLLSKRRKPGPKPTDIGKRTTTYAKSDLSKLELILSARSNVSDFQSLFDEMFKLCKRVSKLASEQIREKFSLPAFYRGVDLTGDQKRELYAEAMNYDYYEPQWIPT